MVTIQEQSSYEKSLLELSKMSPVTEQTISIKVPERTQDEKTSLWLENTVANFAFSEFMRALPSTLELGTYLADNANLQQCDIESTIHWVLANEVYTFNREHFKNVIGQPEYLMSESKLKFKFLWKYIG